MMYEWKQSNAGLYHMCDYKGNALCNSKVKLNHFPVVMDAKPLKEITCKKCLKVVEEQDKIYEEIIKSEIEKANKVWEQHERHK